VAFSPDGSTLATAGSDGGVRLCPVRPVTSASFAALLRKPIAVLSDSSQPVQSVAFAAGARTLIASGNDGIVRLWNVADRTVTASITASSREIPSMSYSSSPGIIATVDGRVTRVWQTDPGQVAANICQTLGAPVSRSGWSVFLPETPYVPICPG
jgi:WD40 repeat protein